MIEKEVRVVMKVEQVGWVTEATEAATTEAKKRSGSAVDAATAAAAAAALAAAEEDVDARAMRGGAAPTQTTSPLPGSPHHSEPTTAKRGWLRQPPVHKGRQAAQGERGRQPGWRNDDSNRSFITCCEVPAGFVGADGMSGTRDGKGGWGGQSRVPRSTLPPPRSCVHHRLAGISAAREHHRY